MATATLPTTETVNSSSATTPPPAGARVRDGVAVHAAPARPDFVDRSGLERTAPTGPCATSLDYQHGPARGHRLRVDPPVDQGDRALGGCVVRANPEYFDPGKLVELAVEGGCNAFASDVGVLAAVSRHWAHRIPFIVKLNHNELLTYPNKFDRSCSHGQGSVEPRRVAVGATIYFGSRRPILFCFCCVVFLQSSVIWLPFSPRLSSDFVWALPLDLSGLSSHI